MVPLNDSTELELRDYLNVVQRRWKVVAVAVLVVVGVALVASLTQTPRYRSEAEVLVRQAPTAVSLGDEAATGTARSLANEVRQAEATAVVDEVRAAVGDEPDLDVRADSDADVLHFAASSSDATRAASAADAYAQAFIAQRRQGLVADYLASGEVLQERMTDLDAEIASLGVGDERRIASLEAQRQRYGELLDSLLLSAELAQGSGAQVIRPAELADGPFEPTTTRNVVLALVVGLVLGVGAAFLIEYLDTSLRTEDDLQAASGGLATLAVVPELTTWKSGDQPHLITREQPQSPSSEAYRALRTSVQFLGIDRTIGTIGFTSASPGDGKTTTAANLAVACARAGQRVVLVDCDLRKPRVHEFFGLSNAMGFTTVLLGEASLETAAHRIADEPGLVVITSGPVPPDPSELLSGKRARSLVSAVAAQADLVIIDSPPVLAVADPLVVAGMVDGMILVASAGRSARDDIGRAVEQLQLVEAPMLGTVLNRSSGLGGYNYGYGDVPADQGKGPSRRSRATGRSRKRRGKTVHPPPSFDQATDGDQPHDWGALPTPASERR
jgi:polysaccharide biosynthesis transport protein